MSEKLLEMKLIERERYDGWGVESQMLSWDDGVFKDNFYVSDMCECPEDAIIGRDLFDAYNFIDAVRLGMSLRDAGYTGIHLVTETEAREEE